MACENCNDNSPNGCVCSPGRKGDPGPANTITIAVTALPAGSTPEVVSTGVSPAQNFSIGFPLQDFPVFTATATTGSPVDALITGTPANPVLNLTIPAGTDGEDGATPVGSVVLGFNMPAVGAATLVGCFPDPTPWAHAGQWVTVGGAGATDQPVGWFVIDSVAPNFLSLRNPGTLDGISVANGYPSGLPQNAAPGTPVLSDGTDTQICVSGRNGPRGPAGTDGVTPVITGVFTPPSTPPVDDADRFVIYYNSPPGTTATEAVPYTWDGASWIAGPNIAGPAGTQTFFQAADPNVVPIPSSVIGDSNWSVIPSGMILRRKATVSSWPTVGTLPFGTATQDIVHAAPGVEALDLAYGDFSIEADKDIELNWSDTNYAGQGDWTVAILNTDAGAIDLTFTAARWEENPALAIPGTTSIAAGAVVMLKFVRNAHSGLYTITNFFVPSAL